MQQMEVNPRLLKIEQQLDAVSTEVTTAWAGFLKETDPVVKAARKEY